jgi:hypothetical protein
MTDIIGAFDPEITKVIEELVSKGLVIVAVPQTEKENTNEASEVDRTPPRRRDVIRARRPRRG